MRKKHSRPAWSKYEKQKARAHGAKPLGGPGKVDAQKGGQKIEIKDRKAPVTRPELIRMRRKKVTKVISKGGFTKPALDYGKQKKMKLYQKKKRVV